MTNGVSRILDKPTRNFKGFKSSKDADSDGLLPKNKIGATAPTTRPPVTETASTLSTRPPQIQEAIQKGILV